MSWRKGLWHSPRVTAVQCGVHDPEPLPRDKRSSQERTSLGSRALGYVSACPMGQKKSLKQASQGWPRKAPEVCPSLSP